MPELKKQKQKQKPEPPPDRRLTPEELGYGPLAQRAGWYASEVEVVWKMCALYVKHVIVPRILAERRRRLGDPTASPKDYACMCPVSPKDGLPICCGYVDNCRFTHRPRPPGPKYCDDCVRHELFKREYLALKERAPTMEDEELKSFVRKLIAWFKGYRRRERAGRG